MEVDKVSFEPRLLEILEALSNAHFVSLDLELSGIASKAPINRKKQSLQERYEQVKEAAERYVILQIGLTCAERDPYADSYVLKPYNFNLSPLIENKRLDLERIFSFQSGAAEFLLSHGFRIDLPFTHGVPYLSRDEAVLAEKTANNRFDKSQYEDLQLKETDVQALEFVDRLRTVIKKWKDDAEKSIYKHLYITNANPLDPKPSSNGLTSFQKRLVHQFVRSEYPDLVTVGKGNGVQILIYNEEQENNIKAFKLAQLKKQITSLTGFRWVVEAMTGGKIGEIDVKTFAKDPDTGNAIFFEKDQLKNRFTRIKLNLKGKKSVLVGHNVFMDLVYFYKTFIGDLPDSVGEFQRVIHQLFPVIIDTKYMVTHNCGDINPASSLEQVEEALKAQLVPNIKIHANHKKYDDETSFHEAGYDSYLTALVAIKLSVKLVNEGTYIEDVPAPTPTPAQNLSLAPTLTCTSTTSNESFKTAPEDWVENDSTNGGVSLAEFVDSAASGEVSATGALGTAALQTTAQEVVTVIQTKKRKKRRKKTKAGPSEESVEPKKSTQSKAIFSSTTIFDQLAVHDMEEYDTEADFEDHDKTVDDSATPVPTVTISTYSPSPRSEADTNPSTPLEPSNDAEDEGMTLMPPFNSPFWTVYGNKLRVFGTVETVLNLVGEEDVKGDVEVAM